MLLRLSALLLAAGVLLLLAASLVPGSSGPEAAAGTPAAGPTPTLTELALEGRALFRAKGCTICHYHAAIATDQWSLGAEPGGPPNLTDYEPDPAFVREWLRDPSAIRPGTEMPTLGLSEEEITALIAFLQEQ
jgi:cytochrome c2